MKLDIKHYGRGVIHISGLRAIIQGQCQTISFDMRISEPSPLTNSYPDIALNKVLMPQIVKALEGMDYKGGNQPCIDCDYCSMQCFEIKNDTERRADETKS